MILHNIYHADNADHADFLTTDFHRSFCRKLIITTAIKTDIGKWSVKKINPVNVKKILLSEARHRD
ncbi:hypothetical protein AU378_17135 [Chryseobacterium kwangjuense]|uniref:Uncharacterized protein n=1 Tax=Chryseobacterium kwangjuense TaxID=267125 RepID=A0A135W964_9FLAO|nr:hypothetical protein AU378_17135 [Chryseobacterium kwangjuense]